MIDLDATLIKAPSDKVGAAPNYRSGFGFHPLLALLEATGEALAGILRPRNAGSTPRPTTSPCCTLRSPSCRSTRTSWR